LLVWNLSYVAKSNCYKLWAHFGGTSWPCCWFETCSIQCPESLLWIVSSLIWELHAWTFPILAFVAGSKVWSCHDQERHLSSQLWVMTSDFHRTICISIVVVWNLLNSEVNSFETWKWEICMDLSLCLILVSRPFRKRNSLQDHLVLDIFSKVVWSFSCTSISRFISIKFIPWVIRSILLYMNVISNWACILWSGMHVRNVVAKSQGFTLLYKPIHNRDIRKVRKRQHQYPEFGHTLGLMVSEFHPVFLFFPERLHCCYIDFHCSYRYSYYNSSRTLCMKCWDSAFRTEFEHFILRFNKISLLCGCHSKRG
jgi:hypothetical protein